jgi:hypothetical protein
VVRGFKTMKFQVIDKNKKKNKKYDQIIISMSSWEAEKLVSGLRKAFPNITQANQSLWNLYFHISNYIQGQDKVVLNKLDEYDSYL